MLQLLRGELTSRLAQVLASHGVRADRLELELTESVIMAAAERSAGTLDELKAISCREWLRTADKVAVGIPTSAAVAVTHDKRLVLANAVKPKPAGG